MSTLSPGEHTAAAERLRQLVAKASKKKSKNIRTGEVGQLQFDETGVPEGGVNNESTGYDNPELETYHGPKPDMTGGAGPRIGANYDRTA